MITILVNKLLGKEKWLHLTIRVVTTADIPKWLELSKEYDSYVKELVQDLTEWYDGNDTSPAFDVYMEAKINKREAFMAVDGFDDCLGIIAISRNKNRISFFGVSHKLDFREVGNNLIQYALDMLDDSKLISFNEISSNAHQIQKLREMYIENGFEYLCDSTENGVPVNTYVKHPN